MRQLKGSVNVMPPPNEVERIELLTFQLDTEIVAVDAIQVREILDHTLVTRVPGAPRFVDGLINVRGQVIPLADLRLRLDLEARPPTQDSRIVVIETELHNEPIAVGIRADKVLEVTGLSGDQIDTAPRIGMRWRPDHIRFVGKRGDDLIIVLNVDRILSDETPHQPHDRAAALADTTLQ
jgi:purine-binding chemotaxis protein CheW